MLFRAFYSLFLFSIIFLTAPLFSMVVTPRQGMSVIMFLVCAMVEKKFYFNKYWAIYIGFIFFYGLSSLATGFLSEYLQRLMGDFFVAYVACWATKIYVEKYSDRKTFLKVVTVFGLLDAIITIGQVYKWKFVTTFVSALNLNLYESYYTRVEYDLDMTMAVLPGLFRSGVMNGHFLMVTAICAFVLITEDKKLTKIFGLFILFSILIASFYTQQRAGLIVAIAFTVFLAFRSQKVKQVKNRPLVYIILAIVLSIILIYSWNFVSTTESRYTQEGLSLTGRENIYVTALDFISDNFFFGGFFKFIFERNMYPHNFFLNAFITGGALGGVLVIVLVFKQLKYIFIQLGSEYKRDILSWILGLAFVATVIDSMVHNTSLTNGDILAWISWTVFISGEKTIS